MPAELHEGLQRRLRAAEEALGDPFRGITTDGTIVPDLFPLRDTGVSNGRIATAAFQFLENMEDPEAYDAAMFDVDSEEWRRWCNIHPFLMRHGLLLDRLDAEDRNNALAVVRASLSDRGFEAARNVMRLNETIREMTGNDDEYGEWLYWLSIFGDPDPDGAWGWQLDGHHLNINCMLVGSQLVFSPAFLGSEPVHATSGRYAGTRVFAGEESQGLALMQSLDAEQQRQALLGDELPSEVFTTAFRDNFELRYEGINFDALTGAQQALLLGLIEVYVGRIRPEHAALKMEEVRAHLDETHFAWIGGKDDEAVFYYRVHSPVLLIEFDHQRGVALDNDEPSRRHVHTIVRTPNGNDYGRDLLRQHWERGHRHQ